MKGRLTIDLSDKRTVSTDEMATQLVAKAAGTSFPIDPLIGAELSHSFSIVASVIRRHGFSIQSELAQALQDTGRYHVMTNFPSVLSDGRTFSLDLLVIDPDTMWAGGYEVKRGLGSIDGARRRQLESDLLALRNNLSATAARLGYPNIKHVTSGIVSYYDEAVFSKELVLRRADLDSHFDAPIVHRIDSMTDAIGRALRCAVPLLFKSVAATSENEGPPVKPPLVRPLGPNAVRRQAGAERWPSK